MKKDFILFFFAFMGMACANEETTQPRIDLEAPVISLLSPSENASLTGNTIPISFAISENDELHNLGWVLTSTDGVTLRQWQTHEHSRQFIADTVLVLPEVQLATTFRLSVAATDHNGNRSEVTTSFILTP